MRTRLVLGGTGVLLAAFGAFRILTDVPFVDIVALALWLAGAVVLHDGVVAPLTLLVGLVLTRSLPPRARSHVQGGLVASALVVVVAAPLVALRGSQPEVKAILLQDYLAHTAVLVGVIALVTVAAYLLRVAADRRAGRRAARHRVGRQGVERAELPGGSLRPPG